MSRISPKTAAFIYHGSSGVPGGYTAKFVEGLARHAHVHAFVNCGYVYPHDRSSISIHRFFFPITDKFFTRKTLLRRIIRLAELAVGYAMTVCYLAFLRADYVIYSPITNLWISRRFVSLAKWLSGRLAVVVHDSQSHYDVAERYRDAIYKDADVLVLHNNHSLDALKQRLDVSGVELLAPFPWSLHTLPAHRSVLRHNVLLIGHVRPSKGIDFLLDAFPKYQRVGGSLDLAVTGSMPSLDIFKRIDEVAGRVINSTLGDQEFLDEMADSKFLIMPYRPGYSNSSVHYCAAIHCGTPFICSDIDLFSVFEHGVDCIKFTYGDVDSFISALRMAEGIGDAARKQMSDNALEKMRVDMHDFDVRIGALFQDAG